MRQRQFFAAFVLACALALSTNAGDISCGVAATPTPTPSTNVTQVDPKTDSEVTTEQGDSLTETALSLLGSVLALF